MICDSTAAASLDAASRTCSILLAEFLCNCCQAFSQYVHVVHPYSSIDAWKNQCFILSVRSDFHTTDSLSMDIHTFASRVLITVSFDETLLPRSVNLSTSFRDLPFSVEM